LALPSLAGSSRPESTPRSAQSAMLDNALAEPAIGLFKTEKI
jgi:hypothetical protein